MSAAGGLLPWQCLQRDVVGCSEVDSGVTMRLFGRVDGRQRDRRPGSSEPPTAAVRGPDRDFDQNS